MKYGRSKVGAILKFLSDSGVKPKTKRTRKKDFKAEKQDVFYQITRIDFAVDHETRIDLIKILTERVGYTHFFSGIPKDYFFGSSITANERVRLHESTDLKSLKFSITVLSWRYTTND
ncbi:MAG: hypothetical protein J0L82_08620 [Deltaproteobacteria bacterium]|nr:hypothetical protein [Deltaproteobacteria bacterium]